MGKPPKMRIAPLHPGAMETSGDFAYPASWGGGIYDSLHATFARRFGAKSVVTRNPGHFAHLAPELRVTVP